MFSSLAATCILSLLPSATPDDLCDPWYAAYGDEQMTGDHVIALWSFDSESGTEDGSGGDHALTLQDAQIHAQGRFGGCLETFPGWPVEDKRHRALAKTQSDLSPQGAFTLEMWVCPKEALDNAYPDSFLLDKKYVAHDDYQLILGAANSQGQRMLRACLGFGDHSTTWYSRPAEFSPGRWRHVAFTYDGAGTGSFYLDGVPWGSKREGGCGRISPGRHPLSIGDRIGSYYHGFPGYIDQVRICRGVRRFELVEFERVSDRSCFLRLEADAALKLRITNRQRGPLKNPRVTFSVDDVAVLEASPPELAAGQTATIACPLDTRLRPDLYQVTARLEADKPNKLQTQRQFDVRIVPRETPGKFPVVMWGVYGGVEREIDRLQRIGFTHALGLSADYRRIWEAGAVTEAAAPEKAAQKKEMLDEALARGLHVAATLSPGSWLRSEERLRRVDRQGTPYAHRPDICGLAPEVAPFCRNVGASMARTYGHFPAWDAALLHTEVRGHARPCFHDHDRQALRESAGIEVPDQVAGPRGVDYKRIDDFPANRVIPDDDPLYVYYRWYWKEGDGWNALNTALGDGLKSIGTKRLWTWHDPAVRVAGVYGSAGGVDVLSQWTYSYPDPLRIGLATDELLAMAAGADPPQRVMKMTQIIWYRSQTAPMPKAGEDPPAPQARWECEQPDAPFITIAPMHLREAFWTKISRPIEGIMYHGWQSLVPCEPPGGYRYTHPQTQHELARLIRRVVTPLGPSLLAIPGVKSDVAFLESFASEMSARRGTYGWGGSWAGDAYHVLLYAHLQPEIVFDETIAERGLDGVRVLVLADCDVLTESVAAKIADFQRQGGIIVGDERLCPAMKPDIRLTSYRRTGRADQDKTELLGLAARLRNDLEGHYRRYAETTNPEVVPYRRRYGSTDYLFLVNDRREYGRYVGQHGIVMENGLPCEATVTVRRGQGFVYDLVEHRPVAAVGRDGVLQFPVRLGPGEGCVYMICSQAIDRVTIDAPGCARRSETLRCRITVTDVHGVRPDAVVPLEVSVRDADGRSAEFSGHYAAVGGELEIRLDIAPNDSPGFWQIEARELASGHRAAHYFRVEDGRETEAPARQLPEDIANPVQPRG